MSLTIREIGWGVFLIYNVATFAPCAFTGELLAWAISAVLNAVAMVVFVYVVERRRGPK